LATSVALYLEADWQKFGADRHKTVIPNWKQKIIDMFVSGNLIGNTNGSRLMVSTVKNTDTVLPCLFCML
jgi:hypothetical protein